MAAQNEIDFAGAASMFSGLPAQGLTSALGAGTSSTAESTTRFDFGRLGGVLIGGSGGASEGDGTKIMPLVLTAVIVVGLIAVISMRAR